MGNYENYCAGKASRGLNKDSQNNKCYVAHRGISDE